MTPISRPPRQWSAFDLDVPKPGDPDFAEYSFQRFQRIAERLSNRGWKFIKKSGPLGFYYVGFNKAGDRLQGSSSPTDQAALLAALEHAHSLFDR